MAENTVNTIKKPSTTIGVDKYTFFELEEDTATGITYKTGYTLPGTVQITPTDSGGNSVFDADNGAYEVDTYLEKVGHDIENADIPPEVDAMWRGYKPDDAGGVEVGAIVNVPYFGVAWRTLKNDGSYRYLRTYKGKYSFASNVGGKTKPSSGSIEKQTAKATYTAVQRDYDNKYYAYFDEADLPEGVAKETLEEKWFSDLTWYPDITQTTPTE